MIYIIQKNCFIQEDSIGVVSIADTLSNLYLTISTYTFKKEMNDKKIITKLNLFMKNYYKKKKF